MKSHLTINTSVGPAEVSAIAPDLSVDLFTQIPCNTAATMTPPHSVVFTSAKEVTFCSV